MTTPTIKVTGPDGRILKPTWRKRADGLVRKGRAYYTAEDHIVLSFTPSDTDAPSDTYTTETEIQIMSQENINISETKPAEEVRTDTKLTVDYLLTQLEKIASDTKYLQNTIEAIKSIPSGHPGDEAGHGKAHALSDVVKCRETTNQQLIGLYEKQLNVLTSERRTSVKTAALDIVMTVIRDENMSPDDKINALEQVSNNLDTVRFLSE